MSDFEGNRSLLNSKTVLFNVNRLYERYVSVYISVKKLNLYTKDAVLNFNVLYSDTSANIQIFIRKFHAWYCRYSLNIR